MYKSLTVLSGTANPQLAAKISDHLGLAPTPLNVQTRADGEVRLEVDGNVRGADVFVVQPTSAPVNYHVMQLALTLDALKRSSAARVTAVTPYYGYGRNDVKEASRTPIHARAVANMLASVGLDRLLTVELHSGQIQGFFNTPVDNLYALPVMLPVLEKMNKGRDVVFVSPDASGVERTRAYANRLHADLAIVDKRAQQVEDGVLRDFNVIGNVSGKVAVIVDDMIDTGGTVLAAAKVLHQSGAAEVHACVTHPVLSGPAVQRLNAAPLSTVLVTDTIPLSEEAKNCSKIQVVSVAGLLAKAIHNIHTESSVSVLFG